MTKSKKSKKKSTSKTFGDVTINDFANSTKAVSRPKKLISNVSSVLQTIEKEKSWDEKEVYEGDFDIIRHENDDGTVSLITKKIEKVSVEKDIVEETPGQEYPLDIWFLLSAYIRPEDVGRFAAICKNSLAVTNTAVFWKNLYKRYYRKVANLPEQYQPAYMYRMYGLKTSVVRALFYMYAPFTIRTNSITTFEKHPDILIRKQCILQWHQKKRNYWLYFFKFKEVDRLPHYRSSSNGFKPCSNLIEMLDDVSANPDKDCQVLRITSTSFTAVPAVMGLALTSVSLSLSQGFQHHRLQLGFGSVIKSTLRKFQDDCSCVLDPVIDLKVLNWWHPLYPSSNNIELLLNDDQ